MTFNLLDFLFGLIDPGNFVYKLEKSRMVARVLPWKPLVPDSRSGASKGIRGHG